MKPLAQVHALWPPDKLRETRESAYYMPANVALGSATSIIP